MNAKRLMAIDIGGKRTGIAIGDELTRVTCPVDVIEAGQDELLLDQLIKTIIEQQPDALVVGMPYNMDGTESDGCKRIRSLMVKITEQTGLPTHEVDERLTSFEIDDRLKGSGLTRQGKKKRQDALVACLLLEDYLRTIE